MSGILVGRSTRDSAFKYSSNWFSRNFFIVLKIEIFRKFFKVWQHYPQWWVPSIYRYLQNRQNLAYRRTISWAERQTLERLSSFVRPKFSVTVSFWLFKQRILKVWRWGKKFLLSERYCYCGPPEGTTFHLMLNKVFFFQTYFWRFFDALRGSRVLGPVDIGQEKRVDQGRLSQPGLAHHHHRKLEAVLHRFTVQLIG